MTDKWHTFASKELEEKLNTDLSSGLSVKEARGRLEKEIRHDGGKRSSLFVPRQVAYFKIALSLFTSPGILLASIISVLSAIFGKSMFGLLSFLLIITGSVICGIVLCNAQKKQSSMYEFASPMVKVIRGGRILNTDGRNVVCGDVILLSENDISPCDAIIISPSPLKVKELVGTKKGIRNRIVAKCHCEIDEANNTAVAPDIYNMIYAGSSIIEGEATAVVTATGCDVYLAKYCLNGELAQNNDCGKDITQIKPFLYKISFIAISLIAILMLTSIILYGSETLLHQLLMLLSVASIISIEIYKIIRKSVLSSFVEEIYLNESKKKDFTASIRDIKTLEALSDVTDIVLLGSAAYSDGIQHITETFFSGNIYSDFTAESIPGKSLMRYIYFYLRGLEKSEHTSRLNKDGISDALSMHLKTCGFDQKGADLIIKSVYFSSDITGDSGYACIETPENEYRVLISYDSSVLSFCMHMKMVDGTYTEFTKAAMCEAKQFERKTNNLGGVCLYIVSEKDGNTVFEGAISLYERTETGMAQSISELNHMGVKVTAMLSNKDSDHLTNARLSELFGDKIAYASDFRKKGREITYGYGNYNAYVGFSYAEYTEFILIMRKKGAIVAAYGIDNSYYDAMSCANISVSCDILNYSSPKHTEKVYEKLPHSGRDSDIRCSQITKLLSKVIIHRSTAKGGGISTLTHTVKKSRAAFISFGYSILLFALIMCTLLPLTSMSVIMGIQLINAVQVICIVFFGSVLSMIAFCHAMPKKQIILQKTEHNNYAFYLLKQNYIPIITRIAVNFSLAILIKLLDLFEVFGKNASYSMPVFISVIFITATELFTLNLEFTEKGRGRRYTWTSLLTIYTAMLSIGAIMTQDIFSQELFPNGIGTVEFIITPVYCAIYAAVIFITDYIKKIRKD